MPQDGPSNLPLSYHRPEPRVLSPGEILLGVVAALAGAALMLIALVFLMLLPVQPAAGQGPKVVAVLISGSTGSAGLFISWRVLRRTFSPRPPVDLGGQKRDISHS